MRNSKKDYLNSIQDLEARLSNALVSLHGLELSIGNFKVTFYNQSIVISKIIG